MGALSTPRPAGTTAGTTRPASTTRLAAAALLCGLTASMLLGCGEPSGRGTPLGHDSLPMDGGEGDQGPCSPSALGPSYIGCEYYVNVVSNAVDKEYPFALLVSNEADTPAAVVTTTTGGEQTLKVEARSALVIKPGWPDFARRCGVTDGSDVPTCSGASPRIEGGAIHLEATRPVTVYQFSPLEYRREAVIDADIAASNDASLLLPTTVWGNAYRVLSWPSLACEGTACNSLGNRSTFAITARDPDTTVEITSTADSLPADGGLKLTRGAKTSVSIGRGDHVEFWAKGGEDFTGTLVAASGPIQVSGGHTCANVPEGFYACDHIEEYMLPLSALAKEYVLAAPAQYSALGETEPELRVLRVVATQDDTALTFSHASAESTTLARAGDFLEVPAFDKDTVLTATKPVLVGMYMVGGTRALGMRGDPSLSVAVPTEQFRSSYLLQTPSTFDLNLVTVVKPDGSVVRLNGKVVEGFEAIPATGFSVARVQLGSDQQYSLTGDAPFGITAYGYGQWTSYAHSGGLDVRVIPVF